MKSFFKPVFIGGACLLLAPRSSQAQQGSALKSERATQTQVAARQRSNPATKGFATDSEYNRLLLLYLRGFDDSVRERKRLGILQLNEFMSHEAKASEFIKANQASILAKLQQGPKTPNKILNRDGEQYYENTHSLLIPSSAASMQLFTLLYQRDLVSDYSLAGRLANPFLCKEGVALLQMILSKVTPDSEVGKSAIKALYIAGVSQNKYRPSLEKMAIEEHDTEALDYLFFHTDRKTGERQSNISLENLTLLKKLSDTTSPPMVRFVCAQYALHIHEYTLAESICTDLITRRYTGYGKPDANSEEDYELAKARLLAMPLMFYELGNETGFKLIYDLSQIVTTEVAAHRNVASDTWVRYDSYVYGRMDITEAQALIRSLGKDSNHAPN